MPSLESEAQAVRRQLERVLESPGFARNERLSRFLRIVVEGHLDGRDHELKESAIAVEVFGRSPDLDSWLDPVVRTEAVRFRARLSDYYLKDGQADALVIELPKGGYAPRFREILEVERGGAAAASSLRAGDVLLCSFDELSDARDSGRDVAGLRFLRGDRRQVREGYLRLGARAEAA